MLLSFLLAISCIENRINSIGEEARLEEQMTVSTTESTEEPALETNTSASNIENDSDTETEDSQPEDPDQYPSQSGSSDDQPEPGSSEATPKSANTGEIVIHELMVNPSAVLDKDGEWIELLNTSDDFIQLNGSRLSDHGVDNIDIVESSAGSLVVEPGGFALICANNDFWNNGGVHCDGTFFYQTFGGGFGLSNGEDEVILRNQNGQLIDAVAYGEGFAPVGESMGIDIDYATAVQNDDLNQWCAQFSLMPQGDAGTPGQPNTWCF